MHTPFGIKFKTEWNKILLNKQKHLTQTHAVAASSAPILSYSYGNLSKVRSAQFFQSSFSQKLLTGIELTIEAASVVIATAITCIISYVREFYIFQNFVLYSSDFGNFIVYGQDWTKKNKNLDKFLAKKKLRAFMRKEDAFPAHDVSRVSCGLVFPGKNEPHHTRHFP